MKASLTNYHQAPRKVRLVANLIKGKKVDDALVALKFLPKRASMPITKLLNSAVANSLSNSKDVLREKLFVKSITVDKGIVMRRSQPRARGRAFPINKRTSLVSVILSEKK